MPPSLRLTRLLLLAAQLLICAPLPGAIVVDGLTTKTRYNTAVTFTVRAEAGFATVATLDGMVLPAEVEHRESRAGYHELVVSKTPDGGGAGETATYQFIVRDAARPASDDGVGVWTPRAPVDAPAGVVDGVVVSWVTPAAVTAGQPFPVVVRLETDGGKVAKLNATARLSDDSGATTLVRLRRGAGAGLWVAPASGPFTLVMRLGTRTFSRQIEVVAPPAQALAGTLGASTTFGAGARVEVGADVLVPAGMTLRFEPGCIVRLAAGVTVEVLGRLEVAGTVAEPVLFVPADPARAWGGFFLRGGAASAGVTGAMLTGAGAAQDWMSARGFSAHRQEQAVFCFDAGTSGGTCTAELTDTWIIDNPLGQAGHGRNAQVTFTRCLIQRTKTSGQYNGGGVRFFDSHAIEMPVASAEFVDGDNDGFYLTNGAHHFRGSVVGWTKDDGIDCGGDPAATLLVEDCWIEGCFHEGFALSGDKVVTVADTVVTNNGQGLECGYSNPGSTLARPDASATRSLFTGNSHGVRYGDNYDWTYRGKVAVGSSFLLHNRADIFGYEWKSWTWRTADMTIEDNVVTAPVSRHPDNAALDPAVHGPQLAAFIEQPDAPRGFAPDRPATNHRADYGGVIELRLDRPASVAFVIPWRILAKAAPTGGDEIEVAAGALTVPPGAVAAALELPALDGPAAAAGWVAVLFDDTAAAVATGAGGCHFLDLGEPFAANLVSYGAVWRYLADGSNQGTAWRAPGFDDFAWSSGPGELGYGNDDEATVVPYVGGTSNKNATTYFRHQFEVADPAAIGSLTLQLLYDDGAVAYLNGQRVAATFNMLVGEPAYDSYIGTALPGTGNAVESFTVPATALVPGTNSLAVEVHQASRTSSDISFDLALTAAPAPATAIKTVTTRLGGRGFLFWSTPGVVPQESGDLDTWIDRPDLPQPLTLPPADPSASRGFYRLKLP